MVALLVAAGCSGSAETTTTSAVIDNTVTTAARTTTTTTTTLFATTTSDASTTTAEPPETEPPWDVWTLIFASLEVDSHTQGDAEAIAATVDGGRVLLSSDYPSLNPGYWVVFAGEWGDRSFAGNQCPPDLGPELTCYPRYLGADPAVLAADWAVVEYGFELVLLNTVTGNIERTVSFGVSGDGAFAGSFSLLRAGGVMFYGLGFEDFWYSCESSRGYVERLDLETGQRTHFSAGFAPSVSPDGRWLAVAAASDCFADPLDANWVLAPADTIHIYDLDQGGSAPVYTIDVGEVDAPVGHDLLGVPLWANDTEILVSLRDDTVRLVPIETQRPITDMPVALEVADRYLVEVSAESYYLLANPDDASTQLTVIDRGSGDVTLVRDFDGRGVNVAAGPDGELLVSIGDTVILPSGEEIVFDDYVYNIGW